MITGKFGQEAHISRKVGCVCNQSSSSAKVERFIGDGATSSSSICIQGRHAGSSRCNDDNARDVRCHTDEIMAVGDERGAPPCMTGGNRGARGPPPNGGEI